MASWSSLPAARTVRRQGESRFGSRRASVACVCSSMNRNPAASRRVEVLVESAGTRHDTSSTALRRAQPSSASAKSAALRSSASAEPGR